MSSLNEDVSSQNHPSKLTGGFGLLEDSFTQQVKNLLNLVSALTDCEIAFISTTDGANHSFLHTKSFSQSQSAISDALCAISISEGKFVQIENIRTHPQTQNLKEKFTDLTFFAGLPLITGDDVLLGTLCIVSSQPKVITPEQVLHIEVIGQQILNLFSLAQKSFHDSQREETKNEYEILFNSSADIICTLDDQLVIQSINGASTDIFGFKPQECLGVNIASFVFPEDRQKVTELANYKLSNRIKNFEIEARVHSKDNKLKWISWKAVTKSRKWFIIGREITKQKQTSKNLQQLSTVASKINNGVVISNSKSEVVWVNDAFTKITGYSLNDLEFKKLGNVIVGDDTDSNVIKQARRETENKKSFVIELLAYRKDGEKIWVSIDNTAILDNNGEIDSLIEIITDITKRKTSEKQLELLSLVASKTNNGVSICNEEGYVTWINEALENILGYKNEEVVGKKLVDLVKGKDTDLDLLEVVREKVRYYQPFNLEHKVYKRDGSEVWLSVANTPIYNEDTKEHNQIEIITDITQRKLAELQLLASREEALSLSRAKESFISVLSHEIRTPLNAVIGLANILYAEEKLPDQEQSINLLKFSADNLLNLINDVLDFSKIEVGKMTLENKRLDIRRLIKDIIDSLKLKVDTKPIELSYHVDPNIPELVRGDKTRLYQILINLISNALKFTQKGSVTVVVEPAPKVNNKVAINFKVIDTGIGIPEHKLDAIFEPFTQAESNTSRKYGGSGLGLSITQKLIELYGGTIKVCSSIGVGSEFSFNINFNKFEGPIDVPDKIEQITIDAKILVVDDNEINTVLAERVLSNFGLKVTTTNSGINAIELLKTKDFDLVLMDVHMPNLNGYETTAQLRANNDPYYKNLPIIALTASILDDHIQEIEKSGMNDFQLKPFKPQELVAKIAKHLKRK